MCDGKCPENQNKIGKYLDWPYKEHICTLHPPFIIRLNVGSIVLIVGLAMRASVFNPAFWTQYRLFLAWTAFASSFSSLITSCLERLFLLACSTASSAAWITQSNAFLWLFAASFSNCSQHLASHREVGWNLEQWKCGMGCPLTVSLWQSERLSDLIHHTITWKCSQERTWQAWPWAHNSMSLKPVVS